MDPKRIRSVCMYCKKVTKEAEFLPAEVSHGICDACLEKHYPTEPEEENGSNQYL